MTPFGPQLIGETEKTLNAILRRVLASTDLTEPHWVTLRVASQHDGTVPLAEAVAHRAHFTDASRLVAELQSRGLLDGDRVTPTGRAVLDEMGTRIRQVTAPVWTDLPAGDVAAAERVLNLIAERGRAALAAA